LDALLSSKRGRLHKEWVVLRLETSESRQPSFLLERGVRRQEDCGNLVSENQLENIFFFEEVLRILDHRAVNQGDHAKGYGGAWESEVDHPNIGKDEEVLLPSVSTMPLFDEQLQIPGLDEQSPTSYATLYTPCMTPSNCRILFAFSSMVVPLKLVVKLVQLELPARVRHLNSWKMEAIEDLIEESEQLEPSEALDDNVSLSRALQEHQDLAVFW
jgi:hypothetical protein